MVEIHKKYRYKLESALMFLSEAAHHAHELELTADAEALRKSNATVVEILNDLDGIPREDP